MLQDLCFLLTVFLPSLWSSWWFDLWRSSGRGETRKEKKLLVVSVDFEGWRGEKMEAAGWNKLRVLAERSTRDTAAGLCEGCSSTGWKFDNELARFIIYCEIIDKRLPLNFAAHSLAVNDTCLVADLTNFLDIKGYLNAIEFIDEILCFNDM